MLKSWAKAMLASRGLFVYRALPRGVDLAYDLRRWLPYQSFRTVFDVGANIGQSATYFLHSFPGAQVWCFEPSAQLHGSLATKFSGERRVRCEHFALGSTEHSGTLVQTNMSDMFHLSGGPSVPPPALECTGLEAVDVTTLDAYCRRTGITSIDFLKVDTEGHDLEVLRGATEMLSTGRIACLQCECSMSPDNEFHRPLEEIKPVLDALGYRIFAVYEQFQDSWNGTPNLRRVNAVFISPQVMEANRLGVRRAARDEIDGRVERGNGTLDDR